MGASKEAKSRRDAGAASKLMLLTDAKKRRGDLQIPCIIKSLLFASAVIEEGDDPLGPAPIQRAMRLDKMRANLMADGPENAMRKFDGRIGRIEFSGFLASADNLEHEFEISLAFGWIYRIGRNFPRQCKNGGEDQPGQILMPSCKIEQGGRDFNQAGLAGCFAFESALHEPERFIVGKCQDGAEEARLALEVIVSGGFGQTCGAKNVLHGSAGIAATRKGLEGRGQNCFAGAQW